MAQARTAEGLGGRGIAGQPRVGDGGSAIDPAVVAQLVRRQRVHDPLERLTDRERDVLSLMAEGRSNQAISDKLYLTGRLWNPTSGASSRSWTSLRYLRITAACSQCSPTSTPETL